MRLTTLLLLSSAGVKGGLILRTPQTTSLSSPSSTPTSTLTTPTSSSSPLLPPLQLTPILSSPPATTQPPELLLDEEGNIQTPSLQQKWHLTTYYTCLPRGTTTACGWHEPVLPGGDEIAGSERREVGRLIWGVGVVWGVVGLGGW